MDWRACRGRIEGSGEEGFYPETVSQLQHELGVKAPRPRIRHHEGFQPDEWWPTELARQLHIPRGTLLHWIRQGTVQARHLDDPLHRWVIWADEAEQKWLRVYHQRAIGDEFRRYWTNEQFVEQPKWSYHASTTRKGKTMAASQKQKTTFVGSVIGLLNEHSAGSIDIVGS